MCGLIGAVDDLLLHEPESDHSQEGNTVLFEEATTDPLVDSVADILDEFINAGVILDGCPLNSLEEEEVEGL